MSIEDLIKQCQAGKRSSQYELVKRYSGMLMSICRRYAYNDTMTKDILQETWIRIFAGIAKYQFTGSFEGWMTKIAIRTTYYWNNKSSKMQEIGLTDLEDTALLSPDIFSQFGEEEIIQLIQALPPGFRAIFNMNVIEGYSHKEIAEILNITESTSRSQLARARRILQHKIQNGNRKIV